MYEKIDKDDKLLRCAASNFRDDLRMHDYVYGHISGNSKKGGRNTRVGVSLDSREKMIQD